MSAEFAPYSYVAWCDDCDFSTICDSEDEARLTAKYHDRDNHPDRVGHTIPEAEGFYFDTIEGCPWHLDEDGTWSRGEWSTSEPPKPEWGPFVRYVPEVTE
ncbi:MAG TPA: hypothetical protein VFU07_07195 [Candidatus Lumbricidophila sp.]|nr:hypothetical protein [Candidatus Lumbricidophila sp.]